MMKKFFFITFVIAFFVSCHNKLEVLAPYKESVAVYGVLNQDDSVNYIRVERVYLGEGNAMQMATVQDSVWFKPGELKVSLQRIKNGAVVSVDNPSTSNMEIVLTETVITTDTGLFNRNELAYRTNHKIYEDSQYRLLIHNNRTGKDFSAPPVGLLSDFGQKMLYTLEGSIINSGYSDVNIFAEGGKVKCMYQAPLNAGICGLRMWFYYTDYTINGAVTPRLLDVDLGTQITTGTDGTDKIDLTFSADAMLDYFITHIGVDPNIAHRTADSIKFVLNGAGYDLGLYNQVKNTTTLAQTQPYYTNIQGGVGIFSTRRQYVIRKRLSSACVYRLAASHSSCSVHPLLFYQQTGGFPPCE